MRLECCGAEGTQKGFLFRCKLYFQCGVLVCVMSAMMKSNQGGDPQQLISAPLFDGDDMDFRLLSDYLFEEQSPSATAAKQTSKDGGRAVNKKSGGGDAKAKKQKKGSLARSVSVESSTFSSS